MTEPVVLTESLGKRYLLGEDHRRPRGGLGSDTLVRAAARRLLRRPRRQRRPEIWALRDIDLEIRRGEMVGVIGRNGSGKSTLLKILTRITSPTTGRAWIRGRAGALLEVGTGFHPELTGRENVFLNGALLGMSRRDIARRLPEIVDFAGVGDFIETPIKRYSTGMQLRLAFAVAAHLEPEVLIVDEVLAVGDAEFQARCTGRMAEVGAEGRTVLFVSHDLGAVASLCRRAIWLDGGRLRADDRAEATIDAYLSSNRLDEGVTEVDAPDASGPVRLERVYVTDVAGRPMTRITRTTPFEVHADIALLEPVPDLDVAIYLRTDKGLRVIDETLRETTDGRIAPLIAGRYGVSVGIPPLLAAHKYRLGLWIGTRDAEFFDDNVLALSIDAPPEEHFGAADRERAVRPEMRWAVARLDTPEPAAGPDVPPPQTQGRGQ